VAVRAELGIPADALVAIHVARNDPMKDHASFLAAMASQPQVRGLLVGAGTEAFALPGNVRALGLRRDVERLYAASDIVVSTSAYAEGFSNAIAEGMSAGLIPIATDVGDARIVVDDTGTVVPLKDAAAVAAAIGKVAASTPPERTAQGRCARARIVEQFSLDMAVERYERLYRSPAAA
jgi:glycosyltransferase involved in cell wall biosynthesis